MNKKIQVGAILTLFVASSTYGCSCCSCKKCPVRKTEKQYARIGQWTHRVLKNIDDIFAENHVTHQKNKKLTFSSDKENIVIALDLGTGIRGFDADAEPNKLIIKIPEIKETIFVTYDKNTRFLSVGREQKQKEEKKDKAGYTHKASYSMRQQGQTIKDQINLEKSRLKYTDGKLHIFIPKVLKKKKPFKKLTVEIEK